MVRIQWDPMPKVVDHNERRRQIAEAACRVIQRDGIDRVTVRTVAAEAGVSRGVMTHYFADVDQLYLYTLDVISDVGLDQLSSHSPRNLKQLIDALAETLPSEPDTASASAVWVSLWGRTIGQPDFATAMRARWNDWRRAVSTLLTTAEAQGVLPKGAVTEDAVDDIVVTIDGINFQAGLSPERWPAKRQRKKLRELINRHFLSTQNK